MKLHRAGEDYLKAILLLEGEKGTVRSLDLAEKLHVTRPSVSEAVKALREGGFLTLGPKKRICLTEEGRAAARQVAEKHRVIKACLISLGVDPAVAEKDACRMEHTVSPETLEQMRRFAAEELSP